MQNRYIKLSSLRFFICILLFHAFVFYRVYEPDRFPEIGKKCPDVVLKNISYYHKKSAHIKDFRGKWLMLDFWNRHCGYCISSFPRLNEKRKKFSERIEIITVGGYSRDPYSSIHVDEQKMTQEIYEGVVKSKNLNLPCAFDSALTKKWDVFIVPYIVIIDPKGIVRAITTGISDEKLDSLLLGFNPVLRYATREHEDKGIKARRSNGDTMFTFIDSPDSLSRPRFAFANENDFSIIVNTDNITGTVGWDTIAARGVSQFHLGDYRTCLQVFNVTYDMTTGRIRGKVNALHYDPQPLNGDTPVGDWVVHFKWTGRRWKAYATKISF